MVRCPKTGNRSRLPRSTCSSKYEPFPFTGMKEVTMTECSNTETNGIRVVIINCLAYEG